MDERAFIQEAKNGDLSAFNRLILAYQDMVYNQAYRLLGIRELAEDATQEAFISAYKKIRTYRGGSFRAWLIRIVSNACYDELRRHKRRPTTPLVPSDEYDEEIESPSWLADPSDTPEEETERSELMEAINYCLQKLSIEFRLAVVLVDFQNMDYSEAAMVSNVPVGTIKSRLARARRGMRQCLQQFWELLPEAFRLNDEASS
ncbi:MAG TPA: sigma-70 family RNA polymerase sigma factor [Anaerolineae bacterium]|nr:sigma-70 family RNA polymerase sigma factor [Anaerolineae bacterium]